MYWRLAPVLVALMIVVTGWEAEDVNASLRLPHEMTTASTTSAAASNNKRLEHPVDAETNSAETVLRDDYSAYFALDHVLDISIEIVNEDWDTLRNQSRDKDGGYTWFSSTVTVDGETHTDVGVRKKGNFSSLSDTKPSLKIRFNKYIDGQSLGDVMKGMTLNNSIQDPSMINTCLSYQVFSMAGNPASRCNFATVSVNGKDLGLYIHVEEIKAPFLSRYFKSVDGNLYEDHGNDFTPHYRREIIENRRGPIEKKTNKDVDDYSDVDAVVAALQDPSDAGLEALGKIVDLDRFLSFWATEVLVGHWDGYVGNSNNYYFYREPGGTFVFIPWGPDDTFRSNYTLVPYPEDDIVIPPPSVMAWSTISNRLYNDNDWRVKYTVRLKEIIDAVWDEEGLLTAVDEMAAIVQQHVLLEAREAAADDTWRVRKFILKRRGEILADLIPEPPDYPPDAHVPPATNTLGKGELVLLVFLLVAIVLAIKVSVRQRALKAAQEPEPLQRDLAIKR